MKRTILLLAQFLSNSPEAEHGVRLAMHHNTHENEKIYQKYPTTNDILSAEEIIINKIKIDKMLAYFIYLHPLSIESFYFYIIEKYLDSTLHQTYKNQLVDITPESLWHFLHNKEIFNCCFIDQVDAIYNYNDFILICKTRMAIEYFIFALNTSLKTTQYKYKYIKQFKLKNLISILYDFISQNSHLLHNTNQKTINDIKIVLSNYIHTKGNIYIPGFLNELSKFKHVLWKLIGDGNGEESDLGYREKLSVCSRFSSIFG
jgi:hypothetical protein